MAKFIRIIDFDGDPSYLNADLIREIKAEDSADGRIKVIHIIYETSDINIPLESNSDIFQIIMAEPESMAISRNLYRIWEILRSRLH